MNKWHLFILLFIITSKASIAQDSQATTDTQCPFCNKKIINRQKFYEDDLVLALYTHKPIEPCHLLILPKRHAKRYEELTEEEIVHITHAIKQIHKAAQRVFGTTSYLLHQKNGKEVGQSVPHVHFHYIGRKKGETSSLKFILKLIYTQMRGAISPQEMKRKVKSLSIAIQAQKSISAESNQSTHSSPT